MPVHHRRARSAPSAPKPTRPPGPAPHPAISNHALTRLLQPPAPARHTIAGERSVGERAAHAATHALTRKASVGGGVPSVISQLPRVGPRPSSGFAPPAPIDAALTTLGGGHPLGGPVKRHLEHQTGHDLGPIRVHDDDRADAICRGIGAKAAAVGPNLLFRRGSYQPDITSGRDLLTHEIMHPISTGHLAPPGEARHRDAGRLVHRYVIQFGEDDYTTGMAEELKKRDLSIAKEEWHTAQTLKRQDKEAYINPGKTFVKTGTFSFKRMLPLEKIDQAERIRIIGHGNADEPHIAGYSPTEMVTQLQKFGLGGTHTGGIEFHGCQPAHKRDDGSYIKQLKTALTEAGINEQVYGYQHTIFPNSGEIEVASYDVWSLYVALHGTKKGDYKLDSDEKQVIGQVAEAVQTLPDDSLLWYDLKTFARSGEGTIPSGKIYSIMVGLRAYVVDHRKHLHKPQLREADEKY